MPFNQSGSHAQANITTYNDVAGNQNNSTKSATVGNITTGSGGDANGVGVGDGAGGQGTGSVGGAGGSVNISS